MKCDWITTGKPDARGWCKMRCAACGFLTAPTPHRQGEIFGCPAKAAAQSFGLGWWVGSLLARCGITKARYTAILVWLGWLRPGESCGCAEREQQLNTWGERIGQLFRRT